MNEDHGTIIARLIADNPATAKDPKRSEIAKQAWRGRRERLMERRETGEGAGMSERPDELRILRAVDAALGAVASLSNSTADASLFHAVRGGLTRIIWLREKGRPELEVVEIGDVFVISDPSEEALFKIGTP